MRQVLKRPSNIFYGWKVLAAASWIRILGGGFHTFALSIFFLPVSRELNLSRTAASLIFSLSRAEGALEGPAAGYLIDRFGARIIMGIGCLTVGIGYLVLTQAHSFLSFTLIYIFIISIGFGASFMHSPTALINHWFYRRRALALAITSAAFSLGGAIFAPVLGTVVHQAGWRTGAIISGAVFILLALPASRLICNTPEMKGLTPLGSPKPLPEPVISPAHTAPAGKTDFTVRRALKTHSFWLLVVGTLLRMFGFTAINLHFIPILVWKGIPEQSAAYYLGVMAAFSIPTHLILGVIGDRFFRPRLLAIAMAIGTAGLLFLLLGDGNTLSLFLFLPLMSVVEGLFAVVWATLGDFFGRKHFATIRGFVTLFVTLGSMTGPIFAGRVFDVSGSYTLVLQVCIVAFSLSSLVYFLMRPPRMEGQTSFNPA
ncbi:MAG: MFS transporter [Dehalococcoidia bacterium]|nr:MFS transporter [Dehalococcoidia bacterium]MDZ4246095.1 MFS transporter [Dehalococcoidia bacterium]